MNRFLIQIHTLIGLYSMSFDELQTASRHFKIANQSISNQKSSIHSINQLNDLILRIRLGGETIEASELPNPEKVQNLPLKAATYIAVAAHSFVNKDFESAK